MTDYARRLPVYLLLDASESMAGPTIEAVAKGVNLMVNELRTNPLAIETAHLSVITFSRIAQQVVPLTELLQFQAPKLSIRSGTALGAALRLLAECLRRDVVKTTATTKGDYKPLVFLLTDGQPTDEWEAAADDLKQSGKVKMANIYAIGCGPDVDSEVLYRITDTVLLMPNLTPEAIRKFFVWLSASVQAVSAKVEAMSDPSPMNLPSPPLDAMEVAPPPTGRRDKTPRQVFLHALCSKNKQPYLMRFVRREYEDRYDAVASHRLETLEEEDARLLPAINSSLLRGIPECPYCGNQSALFCGCDALFCRADKTEGRLVCPKCNTDLTNATEEKNFNIDLSHG